MTTTTLDRTAELGLAAAASQPLTAAVRDTEPATNQPGASTAGRRLTHPASAALMPVIG